MMAAMTFLPSSASFLLFFPLIHTLQGGGRSRPNTFRVHIWQRLPFHTLVGWAQQTEHIEDYFWQRLPSSYSERGGHSRPVTFSDGLLPGSHRSMRGWSPPGHSVIMACACVLCNIYTGLFVKFTRCCVLSLLLHFIECSCALHRCSAGSGYGVCVVYTRPV